MKMPLLCLFVCFIQFFLSKNLAAQASKINYSRGSGKPPIDNEAINRWANVSGGRLTDDGKYVCYTIYNLPEGSRRLIVESTNRTWKREYYNCSMEEFSANSKFLAFLKGKDTVVICTLGTDREEIYSNSDRFLFNQGVDESWIGIRSASDKFQLKVKCLGSNQAFELSNVGHYIFAANNQLILFKQAGEKNKSTQIEQIDMKSGHMEIVWADSSKIVHPDNSVINDNGDQLIATLETKDNEGSSLALLHYGIVDKSRVEILSDRYVSQLYPGFRISKITVPRFSDDSKDVFVDLESIEPAVNGSNFAQVDVWSSRDSVLQSLQLKEIGKRRLYTSSVRLFGKQFIKIENSNGRIIGMSAEHVLVEESLGLRGVFESGWNKAAHLSYFLVSLESGARKLLRSGVKSSAERMSLSPDGNWIVYYDFQTKSYFSYCVNTGETHNITRQASVNWEDEDKDYPEPVLAGGIVWVNKGQHVLVRDSYDLWVLDPSGKNNPVNLTNGFGRQHNIKFTLIENHIMTGRGAGLDKVVYLKAFNKITKESGYYKTRLGKPGNPTICMMGAYAYGFYSEDYPSNPIKAKNAEVFLDVRCSSQEAPNYYVTRDFKTNFFLTDVQPHKRYNWYSVELHTWKSYDGTQLYGMLYKPENFDSLRRYPVIFQYYERRSNQLNIFKKAAFSKDEINIPSFVSNGYLVFVPDIVYKVGMPGESAFNAVLSAADYLVSKRWVNPTRMGLQGHSFGGFETAYIITHSCRFAAAASASGVYDLVSSYCSDARGGYPMYHEERGQGRMGGTLWELKERYLYNSPILMADKVSTPLLMMQNKDDQVVSFSQGVEFFTALRRLGKTAWMLQYDGEDHSLSKPANALDYHSRLFQFFGHYLGGDDAPRWMTAPTPAKLKGMVGAD